MLAFIGLVFDNVKVPRYNSFGTVQCSMMHSKKWSMDVVEMEYFDARQFANLAGWLGLIDSPDLKTFRNGRLGKEPEGWNPSLEDIMKFAVEDASISPALVLCSMYSGLPNDAKVSVDTIERNGKQRKYYSIALARHGDWKDLIAKPLLERCAADEKRRRCIEKALSDNSTVPKAADIRKCFYIHRSMVQGRDNMPAGYGTVAKRAGRSREAYLRFENWRVNRYSYPKVDSLNLYLECCGEYHPLDFIADIYLYMGMSDSEVLEIARGNREKIRGS